LIGLAVVFHVLSTVVLAALVYALLRVKAQRDFLKQLVDCARGAQSARRVWVGRPGPMLGRAASVLGVEVEGDATGPAVQDLVRIEFGPLMELFLSRGFSLLRWTSHTEQGQASICGLEIVLADTRGSYNRTFPGPELAAAETAIRKALGGAVDVRIVQG
jgi:hypothetical protein